MSVAAPAPANFHLPCTEVAFGEHSFDIRHRAVVVGILNRTPDSFFDQGGYFDFDAFLFQAERLVSEGADALDVGGVKAGPGPEVSEPDELERVVPAIEALRARFDTPLCVDTWRATVLRESPSPPVPWWATTSVGSPIPTTSQWPPRAAHLLLRLTSAWRLESPTHSPSTTSPSSRL